MADFTVSNPVDVFMQSSTQALMRTNLGLGNVTNTSDANKPVSTAQQAALDTKRTVFNVKNYGAVGDGVADDTASIISCVAAAKTAKGSIFLPAGTYKTTAASIVLDWEGASVFGDSGSVFGAASTITTTSTTATVISVPADYNSVKIRNLIITGPGRATSTGYGISLRGDQGSVTNVDFAEISGIRVEGFGTGMYFRGVANSQVLASAFVNNNVGVDSLGNNNSNIFQNCAFAADGGTQNAVGLQMNEGCGCSVISCDFPGPALATGLKLIGAQAVSILGGNFEMYGGVGVEATTGNSRFIMSGVTIRNMTGTPTSTSYSVIVTSNAASFLECNFASTVTTTGASVRINDVTTRNLLFQNASTVLADFYSSGVFQRTTQVATEFPTYVTSSVEVASASNAGKMRRRSSGGEDLVEICYFNGSTYAWVDFMAYHKAIASNGNPAYLSLANTFTSSPQAVVTAANPYWQVRASGDADSAPNRVSLMRNTSSGSGATGTNAGDSSLIARSGGNLNLATGLSGVLQVVRAFFTDTGIFNLSGIADLILPKTITAGGTTGARTINQNSGSVNFAAAATSLVVTNSLVTANSVIMVSLGTADSTAVLGAAVAGSGSFTINMKTAPTAETRVNFLVTN